MLRLLLAALSVTAAARPSSSSHKAGSAAAAAAAEPATVADLPKLGAGGAPVLTVDGRVCAFPWIAPDGASHASCAPLPGVDGGSHPRLWCKDAQELWAICAAPAKPAKHANANASAAAASAVAPPAASAPAQPVGGSAPADAGSTAPPADGAQATPVASVTPRRRNAHSSLTLHPQSPPPRCR
jgi:hypothetical protein